MAKMGAPRKEMDWEEFDQMCKDQCTLEEIAGYMRMSADTVETRVKEKFGRTFSEVFKEKRRAGIASLRSAQMKAALAGNPTMLIWMGKQLLGQTDKIENRTDVNVQIKPLTAEQIREALAHDPFMVEQKQETKLIDVQDAEIVEK